MNKELKINKKKLEDMSPEEEKGYIDKINYNFTDWIKAAPFIEIGYRPYSRNIILKSRTGLDDGMCSVGEIIFELQYRLYSYQKRHEDKGNMKMIVSELSITKETFGSTFMRGVMISIKYEQR